MSSHRAAVAEKTAGTKANDATDVIAAPWSGPTRRYDIVKEGTIALVIVSLLTLALAALFSSPDDKSLTFQGWAASAPDNFYSTTVTELDGTSTTASYGPPYNAGSDGLSIGPLKPQAWMGVRIPIDAAQDLVLTPLESQAQPVNVTAAIKSWTGATADQQVAWATTYDTALNDAAGAAGDATKVPAGDYGPVPALASGLLVMAASGSLDGVLMARGGFYQSDHSAQIMFMGDGSYLDDAATAANLQGGTWGMMNETGRYPGQAWLWLYSLWYQVWPFTDGNQVPFGANADAWIFTLMGFLSLVLVLLPFIPGLRSIPRWIPIHRLIWRQWYHDHPAFRGPKV